MTRCAVVRLLLAAVFVGRASSLAACSIGLNLNYDVATEVLTVTASGAHADCRGAMYAWQIPALNMSGSGGCPAPCTVNETKTYNACLRTGSYTVEYYAQCGEDDPNGPASDHCKNVETGTQTMTLSVQRPDPKVTPSVKRKADGSFEGWIEYEFPQTLSADRRNLLVRMLPKGKQPGGVIKDTFGESLAISGTYGPISLPPNRTFKVEASYWCSNTANKKAATSGNGSTNPMSCPLHRTPGSGQAVPPKSPGSAGAPVDLWSGEMYVTEHDPLPDDLGVFARTYRSLSPQSEMRWFGIGWFSAYDATAEISADTATVYTEHQTYVVFDKQANGTWTQTWPATGALPGTFVGDETSGYTYREGGSDIVRTYSAGSHRLTGIRRQTDNLAVTITYDSAGKPVAVADGDGRWSATVTTNTSNLVTQIAIDGNPDLVWNYTYTNGGVYLSTVKLATAPVAWHTYEYESQNFLARIKDSAGVVIEEHAYDGLGRATSSIAAGLDLTNFSYQATSGSTTTTTVTDARGNTTTYYQEYLDQVVTTRVEGSCTSCGAHDQTYAFDDRTRLNRVQDAEGYIIEFTYEADGTRVTMERGPLVPSGCDPATATDHCRLTSTALAAATLATTSATKTATYVYDTVWTDRIRQIQRSSVLAPGNSTTQTLTFDPSNAVTVSNSITGYTGNDAHAETHTTTTTLYDGTQTAAFDPGGAFQSAWLTLAQPAGLTRIVDGPRSDVSDVVTYVYYPRDQAVTARLRGRLAAVRNALGQVTRYDDYDVFGRPLTTVDANGVATNVAYDALGRVTATTLNGVTGCDTTADPLCATNLTTTSSFTNVTGPLATTTTSSGVTAYTYDPAGRIATVSRGPSATDLRERVSYTYDPITEQKATEVYAANVSGAWVEKRRETYAYDGEGNLATVTHPDTSSIAYTYDGMNRVKTVRDENHATPNTTYTYDPAGRLASVKQTLAGAPSNEVSTSYAYDLHDNLTSVTDPNGNVTTYQYDDLGRLLRQASPVTGVTTYTYDPAGNLLTTTDANSSTTTRSYDAANRVTSSSSTRSGSTETVTWTYDDAVAFGKGRLRTMTDPTGSTTYAYDRRGLLLSEQKSVNGASYTSRYQYDQSGNRTRMTYPSGRVVDYTFDFADRPYTATTGGTTLVSAATYMPFGPMTSATYGNGTTKTVAFDNRYRITENKLAGPAGTIARYVYGYDNAGNITAIDDAVDPTFNRSFGYDDLHRLTTANTGTSLWGTGSYSYDRMGNLQTQTIGTWRNSTFAYQGTTPKLASVTESGATRSVAYDPAGNEATVGSQTYAYNPRNNLVSGEGIAYAYDGRGVRTITSFPDTGVSIASITFSPTSVTGGQTATGTVALTGAAPTGGVVVDLSHSNAGIASGPATVTVPAGATSATFTVTTSLPTGNYNSITRGSYYDSVRSATLLVRTEPAVTSVSVSPTSLIGGAPSTGTVTLDNPATGSGATVTLSSSDASASVPSSVTVTAGSTTATFTITTTAPSSDVTATISATLRGTRSAALTVRATPIEVSSVTVAPPNVVGGKMNATGTVTLSAAAPPGGSTVALASSDTTVATVPATVSVAQGSTTATFTITTSTVTANTQVSLSATYGTTQSATLNVTTCAGMVVPAATLGTGETIWVEDALPSGAVAYDTWLWDTNFKASGTQSHHDPAAPGAHSHSFGGINEVISNTDQLFAYVMIDPCNPPREIMLQWSEGSGYYYYKAYWGENLLPWGTDGTGSRRYMGPLPPAGQWVKLVVPPSLVDYTGSYHVVREMAFSQYDGHAWFDRVGKQACSVTTAPSPSSFPSADTVWFDDALPTGASASTWTWDTTQKASGTQSHTNGWADRTTLQHSFSGATQTMTPGVGDKIYTYVLLDPCMPPAEIMLQWYDGSGWEHRAYWGSNQINSGTNGTNSRRYMGPIPSGSGWKRLEVPASQVGLEGVPISGMAFRHYAGKVWWDRVGIAPAGSGALGRPAPVLVGDVGLPSRRARMWTWIKRRFRREPDAPPVSFSILAQVMDAGQTKQRYSLYTPELNLMAETNASTTTPTIANEYVWFGGEPLAQIETATNAVHWYLDDQLGAPMLTTNSAGSVDWRIEREPYGPRYSRVGADRYQPLGLPGQEVGEASERQYNIARWYRDRWGRYTQPDPLGLHADLHEFGYSSGRPTVAIDRLGLRTCLIYTIDSLLGIKYVSHTALVVFGPCKGCKDPSRPKRYLYDPAGGYVPKGGGRGSGGLFVDDEFSIADYFEYHRKSGSTVEMDCFETTCEEEQKIYDRADEIGDPRGFSCAASVSGCVKGLPSLGRPKQTARPGALRENARAPRH